MRLEKNYKRIVLKVGASLLYDARGRLIEMRIRQLIRQVAVLAKQGKEALIVSSGAIALGMHKLKLKDRPRELSLLQAAAAAGQHELMSVYQKYFSFLRMNCAQVLLTWEDFAERRRYLNARNTLERLIQYRCVPVINENDTVSTDEIKFGDNDKLSALVAVLTHADLLIILSDVDGIWQEDKKTIIRLVEEITPRIRKLACPTDKQVCVGGMATKVGAVKLAIDSGIPCVIANGHKNNIITCLMQKPIAEGTWFLPKQEFLAAKERWIAFAAKPKGKIIVDEGARLALLNGKSLLSVGITSLSGRFEPGDVVLLCDKSGDEFARGRVRLSFRELEKVKGTRQDKEIIHRDNLVILSKLGKS